MDDKRSSARKHFYLSGAAYVGCLLAYFFLKSFVRPRYEHFARSWELTIEFVTTISYALSAICLSGALFLAVRAVRFHNVAWGESIEQKEDQARRQCEWEEEYARAEAWLQSSRNDNGQAQSL